MLHDPCEDMTSGLKIAAINNNSLIIVNGAKIQVWGSTGDKRWTIKAEFQYQELKVLQTHTDIKYRLGGKQSEHKRSLVFLHENGVLTFWD